MTQWIWNELYGAGLVVCFIAMALIFERMRRAACMSGDEGRSREVLYWQRQRDRLSAS